MKAKGEVKPQTAPEVPPEEPTLRLLDRWWFGYGSPTTLGVFRILVATIILLNLLSLTSDWPRWFSEKGFVPAWVGQLWLGSKVTVWDGFEIDRLNLIGGVTDPRLGMAFFGLAILVALTTALGLFTRASAFLLAICLVSLHHRNTAILHGGDTVMRIAALYLAVSPCGRACSLDRLFRLRRGEDEEEPEEISLWPQRLIQFNTALIYFTTVWSKWFGEKWMNGTATYYPARLNEFNRFPVPRFFNEFPMVYFTTYGTLVIEFSLATLVFFRPLRRYVLFAGVMLHGYIEYAMNIPFFSFLMLSFYVSHYDGGEISGFCKRLGDRLRNVMGLEVSIPSDLRLTVPGERFLHAVDPFGLVRYMPGAQWEAKKPNGKNSNPFRGVAYRAPGAWLFMLIPGLWRRMMLKSTEAIA